MKKLNVILMGPPGAGKGTQAKFISDKFKIPHISTGDIFRDNISNKTSLGKLAKSYIDKGQLVPDDVTIKMVESALAQDICKNGFLLDGFPRNLNQAESLDKHLKEKNSGITNVILIEVKEEKLIKRITTRRVCLSCGASYNVIYNPPKVSGICDVCGSKLVQRKDDTEETLKERLNVYEKQTAPLIEYYKKQDILYSFDGDQSIENIFNNICQVLESDNK